MNGLFTVGEVARQIGVPQHVVRYAVLIDGIEPVGRAGVLRLFDKDGVRRVREAVARRAAKKGAK